MQLGFGLPLVLLALPPLLGLIWWWYRRRRPPERRIAGIWLWQQAQRKGQARRRFDWRLFLLLLAASLGLLALSAPKLSLQGPGALVVVLDASASMAATDLSPSRLEQAKQLAQTELQRSPRAVLVVVGKKLQSFGPASGKNLIENLKAIVADSPTSDLKAGIARGRQLLPEAKVLLISDATPPAEADGYFNVAGNGQNIGITAVGPGFIALANSGPGLWDGQVSVEGKPFEVRVPAGGFATLEVPYSSFEAKIVGSDALALDDQASFSRRRVRVEFGGTSPALERLLSVLGIARGSPAELSLEIATPKEDPKSYTVYFAPRSSQRALVFDAERTLEVLRGVELVGYSLAIPPPPAGSNWRPLAVSEDGKTLAWYHPNGLYLPPVDTLQNLPAFPILLYNLIAPRSQLRSGLLQPSETLLPRPTPNRPLPPGLTLWLTPWLALLGAAVLGLEAWLFGPQMGQIRADRSG